MHRSSKFNKLPSSKLLKTFNMNIKIVAVETINRLLQIINKLAENSSYIEFKCKTFCL